MERLRHWVRKEVTRAPLARIKTRERSFLAGLYGFFLPEGISLVNLAQAQEGEKSMRRLEVGARVMPVKLGLFLFIGLTKILYIYLLWRI